MYFEWYNFSFHFIFITILHHYKLQHKIQLIISNCFLSRQMEVTQAQSIFEVFIIWNQKKQAQRDRTIKHGFNTLTSHHLTLNNRGILFCSDGFELQLLWWIDFNLDENSVIHHVVPGSQSSV